MAEDGCLNNMSLMNLEIKNNMKTMVILLLDRDNVVTTPNKEQRSYIR